MTEMVNKDPFAPVRLQRFMDGDRPTDKVYIQIMKEDESGWECPTGTAVVHGEGYRLISNHAMHTMLQNVMRKLKDDSGMEFRPLPAPLKKSNHMIWNGKAYAERWFAPEVKFETPCHGNVMLGVEARNSYDRSSQAVVSFYLMHCCCQNQFHSNNLFGKPLRIAHVGADGDLDENIDNVIDMITSQAANIGNVIPKVTALCNARLKTAKELLDFYDRCEAETGLVLNDCKLRKELAGRGVTSGFPDEHKVDYSQYGDKDSLWALVNAFTAITTHETGGISGAEKSARFVDFAISEAERIASEIIEL